MKPRNFGKKRNPSASQPPAQPQTPEQQAQQQAAQQQKAASEKQQVKNEIRQQLAEKLTELSLDEHIIKGWLRDVLREELAGFMSDYKEARENWLLAIGGDKRDKPAATDADLEAIVGKDNLAKLKKIDYRLGKSV